MCVQSQTKLFKLIEIMKTFGVFNLVLYWQTLTNYHDILRLDDANGVKLFDEKHAKRLGGVFGNLKSLGEELQADSSLIAHLEELAQKLEAGTLDRRPSALLAQVDVVQSGIQNNLMSRYFLLLSKEEVDTYNNPNLFGESFKERYSARALKDVLEAGNCYSASLYTACVFHSMRVAEYGLRKLARNSFLRIKLTQKKGKPHAIEYADWQKVIDGIRSKITKIRQCPTGPKRERDLQFFSIAADQCEYMKDIWRNELSHTRRSYNADEARSVMNRVKEFVTTVGEHSGSAPDEDSLARLIERSALTKSTSEPESQ